MRTIVVILAAAVVSLGALAASDPAEARHKRHHLRPHAYPKRVVPVYPRAVYPAPIRVWPLPRNRPPWAAPWECYTDEGYGRFRSCSAGPR